MEGLCRTCGAGGSVEPAQAAPAATHLSDVRQHVPGVLGVFEPVGEETGGVPGRVGGGESERYDFRSRGTVQGHLDPAVARLVDDAVDLDPPVGARCREMPAIQGLEEPIRRDALHDVTNTANPGPRREGRTAAAGAGQGVKRQTERNHLILRGSLFRREAEVTASPRG